MVRPQTLNYPLSHYSLTFPIYQQILLSLPSKYTQNLATSHHFHCYRPGPSLMNFCLDYCNSLLLIPPLPLCRPTIYSIQYPEKYFQNPSHISSSPLNALHYLGVKAQILTVAFKALRKAGFSPPFRLAVSTCPPCFSNTGLCRSGTRMATPQALRTSSESSPPPLPRLLLRNYLCSSVTFPATPSLTARYKMATIPIQHPCSPFLSLACSTGLLPYNKLNSLLIYLLLFSPNWNRNPMNKAGTIFFFTTVLSASRLIYYIQRVLDEYLPSKKNESENKVLYKNEFVPSN